MNTKRIDALLSNLGYCTRGEVKRFLKLHKVFSNGIQISNPSQKISHDTITIDDEPIDPATLTLLFYKPKGVVCSHDDSGKLIYSLLPQRWQNRNPKLSTVGRLDKDTTGAILLTDDGKLNHNLTSPKNDIPKVYQVTLAHPLKGDEKAIFESGSLLLHGETKPLLPAKMTQIDEKNLLLEIQEGRYHQVKRMFGAVGNRVLELHRVSFGIYSVAKLQEGEYKIL